MTDGSSPRLAHNSAGNLAEERQPQNVAAWRVALVGVGTGAALLVSLFALLLFFHFEAGDPRAGFRPAQPFPPPRLQTDPAGDLRDWQAKQEAELEGYAWVDRQHGLVRVPVARAMQIIAGRGDAAYAPLDASP